MAVPDMIKTTLATFVQNVIVAIDADISKTNRLSDERGSRIASPLSLLAPESGNISDSTGILGSDRILVGANSTGGDEGAGAFYDGLQKVHLIAVSVMLTCFSIFGILGNGLVLYVFSRKSDRVTSTIFILALAWTDFFTCLVIMPFTVTNLQLNNHLTYTGFCKLFQFVITFGVPLSVFIMVAIAVDRYFSICHPFSHMITPKRAKISILCLLIFAMVLGFITSCMYSTYSTSYVNETAVWCLNRTVDLLPMSSSSSSSNGTSYRPSLLSSSSYSTAASMIISPSPITTQPTQRSLYANSLVEVIVNQSAAEPNSAGSDILAQSAANCTRTVQKMIYEGGRCVENERIFSYWFMDLYQKIFISFYIISLLSVFMLYFFIYRSVAQRRKWRRRQKSCSFSPMTQMVNTNPASQQGDVGVTPDKVAALNNRDSAREGMNNGRGQTGGENIFLKPWSHGNCDSGAASSSSTAMGSSSATTETTSSTELGSGQHQMVKLTVTPSSQSNNNGNDESQAVGGEVKSPDNEVQNSEDVVVPSLSLPKTQPQKKSEACDQLIIENHGKSDDGEIVEKAGDGHENGVGKRLTLTIPSAQPTAAEKKSSRERRDFNFLANIRTAMMLFVVTVVFTACFMPAWLMAAQLLTYQPIVFYSHFLYNVANPVIYAFMNQSFRKELKRVFQRDCRPWCCCGKGRARNPHQCNRYTRTGATSLCESPDETRSYHMEPSFHCNQDSMES